MATLLARAPQPQPLRRSARAVPWALLGPTAFTAINAIAFFLIRPDVNDLWAARARATAVDQGVGLFYWFSWFGGGATPGNYSIVTPYLSAWIGTELVGALSAVAVTIAVTIAVRDTVRPNAAALTGAVAASINLWSGRVPFLLGSVFAVGVIIAVRRRRRFATVFLTIVAVLASPVLGAFVAVGLSGTFLSTTTKAYRGVILYAVGTAVACLGIVGLLFGTPGAEPFADPLMLEVVAGHLLLLAGRPPNNVRATIWVSLLAAILVYSIPNGMGSNYARIGWFCLPVAVVAVGAARRWLLILAVVPVLVGGAAGTVTDLINAGQPVSSIGYYRPLAQRLDRMDTLDNCRVEIVNHGAHAGYEALLGHAILARGWETQEDGALNKILTEDPLDPVKYKIWLDNNAVCYVAMPSGSVGGYSEYTLVQKHTPKYLTRIWRTEDWQLFKVKDPTPIVPSPAALVGHTQSSMTIDVPCVCSVIIRVRWSKFLSATLQPPAPASGSTPTTPVPAIDAKVTDDGTHWTLITTTRAGVYKLHGSVTGLLR